MKGLLQIPGAETSDLRLDGSAFDADKVPLETRRLNESLAQACAQDTKWWKTGAAEYRRRRRDGETPFPPPTTLDNGTWLSILLDTGPISCRVFEPPETPRGVFYHIHGGGFVLGSAGSQDPLLDEICRKMGLVVVSVEYRLAPEHRYPAAMEDCVGVADWLIAHSFQRWKCQLSFVGGESAGATLAVFVLFHLRKTNGLGTVKGAVLNYGHYDYSMLPSMKALDPNRCLVLGLADSEHFLETYLPDVEPTQMKLPSISALYNDLEGLPSALFIVGTEDGLLDDNILMAAKWQLANNAAVLKFVPGAFHGFMVFNGHEIKCARQGWDILLAYVQARLAAPDVASQG